ncbi:MAG: DUF1679 domain-containing protein [Chloroflexi bacterium]|nr:MAG: DUF1679 domain-containing protein [Chloroflexota bacterium]
MRPEPIGIGRGMFGQVIRLRLTYSQRLPGDPVSLVLKTPAGSAGNRAQAIAFDMYTREACFYRELAPTLRLSVPRCYFARVDPDTGEAILVLEDLGRLQSGDQVGGLDASRARTAVTRLAAAHAQWWDAEALRRFSWLPSLDSPVMRRLERLYGRQWPAFIDAYGAHLPAGSAQLGARVAGCVDEVLVRLSRPPATLVHGDFRADNLYFAARRDDDAVVVADWQVVSRGRAAFDVAYLLCQSMTSDVRRRHEWALLRSWHATLVACGVTGYSFGDALADYSVGLLLAVVYAVVGATLDRGDERGIALARAQAARTFTAALDSSQPLE